MAVDSTGQIVDILKRESCPQDELEVFKGVLCPGFINAHCHLELSHMRGILEEKTGLIPFINGILANREAPTEVIQQCMAECDTEMYENGIVAVGDISNTIDSFNVKSNSKIYYHTFVEIFDLDPKKATTTFDKGMEVYHQLSKLGLSGSLAPHAPYTVSKELFHMINSFNKDHLNLSTLHNQETLAENDFYLTGKGLLNQFFNEINVDISFFEPTGKKSLPSTLGFMSDISKVILAHNTVSEIDDIQFAERTINEVFWCTNPNANLYIENRLPEYQYFIDQNVTLTVGTDSIASNWQLSIYEEMRTIKNQFPHITTEQLLRWATSNGAKALGIDNWAGSFSKGMKPGIVHIESLEVMQTEWDAESYPKRLI